MNPIRKSFVIGMLLVLVLGAVSLAFSASPVYAQSGTPSSSPAPKAPAQPGAADAKAAVRLERIFKAQQNALERQSAALEKGAALVTKAEALITALKGKGVDTSKIEAALATFVGQLAAANDSHSKAAAILASHAGFDAQGKVTDRALAAQTVKDAGQALKETRKTIAEGRKNVIEFLKEWRKDHKPEQPAP